MEFSTTITATLPGFSCCEGERPVYEDEERSHSDSNNLFSVKFYANGSCTENEGHVSITFNFIPETCRWLTFACTASVIDASGHKRFPQSFAVDQGLALEGNPFHFFEEFGFERYLKRSTLLNDPSELLPEDSLTLLLEIVFHYADEFKPRRPKYRTSDGIHEHDGKWYLRMDTEFARDLRELSSVLQRMMETDMAEKRTGRVLLSEEEVVHFMRLFSILKYDYVALTLPDICNMYVLADKYDMQPITQLCHRLLIGAMREITTQKALKYIDEDVDVLSELAERFHDDISLREILTVYSDVKNELENGTGELIASIANRLEIEWNCYFREDRDEETYKLIFTRSGNRG